MMDYSLFLKTKEWSTQCDGVDVGDITHHAFEFQRDAIKWALRKGRAALFFDCGLGKTLCQLEWARHIPGDVLILAPLAVSNQTIAEADKFGLECVKFPDNGKVTITNYERLHLVDPEKYTGIVLDESSILKSHTGKYRTNIIDQFKNTRFKLCCTATPAPNDTMELGNHVEFLGIMKRAEFLATWFCHDGGDTSKWRLKRHAQERFWEWMATWSIVMRSPSDLGYMDDNFVLPDLHYHEHFVGADPLHCDELFALPAVTMSDQRMARRKTLADRVRSAADLVSGSSDTWIVWCELNDESSALVKAIPDSVELTGSQQQEKKEETIDAFSRGDIRVLITKPKIGGFGMNWQHCSHQCFVGLSHSFEQTYQAIRRSWRFGQESPVHVHVIVSELEETIIANVRRKQQDHERMVIEMIKTMKDHSLHELHGTKRETKTYQSESHTGDDYQLFLGDCVDVIQNLHSNTVGLSVFSPPFASLYTYSASDRDMGNCRDYQVFMEHFAYIVSEISRVTIPGRNCCVHCMDLPILKHTEGHVALRDFPGMIIAVFEKAGWYYHSRVTIWKDPVTAMQRTKAIGLLWKQLKKDSIMSRMGIADYVLTFRNPGDNPEPVSHSADDFPVERWQEWASPVWMDINPSDTLQRESARDEKDERHIAPLQLGVVRRCVRLWSNEGDTIFSPFAGIGSEGVVALQENREFIGVELKESYYRQAIKNLDSARKQMSLFSEVTT